MELSPETQALEAQVQHTLEEQARRKARLATLTAERPGRDREDAERRRTLIAAGQWTPALREAARAEGAALADELRRLTEEQEEGPAALAQDRASLETAKERDQRRVVEPLEAQLETHYKEMFRLVRAFETHRVEVGRISAERAAVVSWGRRPGDFPFQGTFLGVLVHLLTRKDPGGPLTVELVALMRRLASVEIGR